MLPADVADALLRVARGPDDVESTTRALLEFLQLATGVDSTYLTVVHWHDAKQEILMSHNTGALDIHEGLLIDWCDTLCRQALMGSPQVTDDVPGVYGADSVAARDLGLVSYVSVPITLPDGAIYGTLCGASGHRTPIAEEALELFQFASLIIAAEIERDRQVEVDRTRALEAERRFRSQALAVAALEHQLKTPLTVLLGWADTLEHPDGATPEQWDTASKAASRHLERLRTIVDELLAVARTNHDPQLGLRVMDIAPVIAEAAADHERAASERLWRIDVRGPIITDADPAALEQAVSHLLENAIKYTAAGDTIEVEASADANTVIITVRDTGIGVPEDTSTLFDPFVRSGRARTDSAGLGLYIVATIVGAHNGKVTATRRPTGGSSFEIRLPAL